MPPRLVFAPIIAVMQVRMSEMMNNKSSSFCHKACFANLTLAHVRMNSIDMDFLASDTVDCRSDGHDVRDLTCPSSLYVFLAVPVPYHPEMMSSHPHDLQYGCFSTAAISPRHS